MNFENYKGKKVFLTGHTGFKGTWLLYWLKSIGAEVMGYALAAEVPSLYDAVNGNTLCDSIIADVRDKEKLAKSISDFQPDYVFHLAAQPLVRYSYEHPAETFDTNVMGTINVLESVRNGLTKSCCIIIITTDKVYENREWIYPYRENERLGGHDPYSASKACAELAVASYAKSFFNVISGNQVQHRIAVARAGNVIGGGDWSKDRIIPDIVKALIKGEEIQVRNPASVRPWQHVLEPLSGYLMLGTYLSNKTTTPELESFNFGPGINDTLSVQSLVELAIELWGNGSWYTPSLTNSPHEAGLLKLDINKAATLLNWTPKLSAAQAIGWTLEWYKAAAEKRADIVMQQINAFSAQA